MKDRQTRDAVEGTCCEIVIIANSHYVRVAIVSVDDGIGISAIAIVWVPHL